MERDNSRGRGRQHNDMNKELRRPHANVPPVIDGTYSFAAAVAGDNSQKAAPPSNAIPSTMSLSGGDFVAPVSRTEHVPLEYAFSAEAVNVPPKQQQQQQQHARLDPKLNDFVKNSKLSPLAKEFVPKSFVQGEAPAPSGSTVPSQLEYMVCLVQEFIFEVTLNPGKFDEEVLLLTETLNDMVKTADLTKALVEIIYKQAIQEPNFRYNGARLCNHLNRNLDTDSLQHTFKFFLLEKCQVEYEQRGLLIKSDPLYLRGVVFFFGELYSQVLQPSGERINILRKAIICLLDALFSDPTQDNIKCACQVIKMTGANLDDDERQLKQHHGSVQNDQLDLDQIFRKLTELNAPRDLTAMIRNVIQLRSIDWGRSNCPPPETLPPPQQQQQQQQHHIFPGGAVFYGPDGKPITTEEVLFLENQSYYDYRLEAYDDDFNDEIAADYESFLREIGQ